jgi:hypothetical protein
VCLLKNLCEGGTGSSKCCAEFSLFGELSNNNMLRPFCNNSFFTKSLSKQIKHSVQFSIFSVFGDVINNILVIC